jgi:hypothetical protein
MTTMTSTTSRFFIETYFLSGYAIVDSTTGHYVRNERTNMTRVFKTRNSARKAVTRLNRPAGDRHR